MSDLFVVCNDINISTLFMPGSNTLTSVGCQGPRRWSALVSNRERSYPTPLQAREYWNGNNFIFKLSTITVQTTRSSAGLFCTHIKTGITHRTAKGFTRYHHVVGFSSSALSEHSNLGSDNCFPPRDRSLQPLLPNPAGHRFLGTSLGRRHP